MGKKKSKNSISKRYNEEKVWKRSTTILSMLQALEFCRIFFCLKGKFLSLPWDFLHYDTIILQRIRIIVGDAGFEPGTLAPEVWCTKISNKHIFGLAVCTCCCSPRTYLVWLAEPVVVPRGHIWFGWLTVPLVVPQGCIWFGWLTVPVVVPRGHIWFGCVYLLLFPEYIFDLAVCTCWCSPRTYLVWLCVPVVVPRGLLPEDVPVLLRNCRAKLAAARVEALLLEDLGQAGVSLELTQAPATQGGNLQIQ